MSDRIASFPNINGMIGQALQLQANYNTANIQTSSGLKSQYFSGIAGDAQRVVDLSAQYDILNSYTSNIATATNKVNVVQSTMSNIGDLLSNIKSQLTSINSGTNAASSSTLTTTQATDWLNELSSLLNSQYAGKYVFGGNVTDTAPVNLQAAAYNPTSFSTADTGYYQGDNNVASVRAGNDFNVSYGINANNPAFEQAFRALKLVIANPTNTTVLTQAMTTITNSNNAVADMTSDLATKLNLLDNESQLHGGTVDLISTSVNDLRSVDTAAASANLSAINTQLQTSYSALALVLKLNLSSYLR